MKGRKLAVLTMGYLIVFTCFTAATYWGSRAVTVLSERIPLEREHTIIIDAGHGGIDGGATSCTGKPESALNLEISLKLNDLLHLLGCNTAMIRTTDCSIHTQGETIAAKKVSDLKERVRIVNDTENPLLISIHQNTFSDSQYHGAQVFYTDTEGSHPFASQMQNALVQSLNPESNRKCKQSKGVYLMEHIEKTGILVECGFLSNPEEDALLQTPDYHRKLSCVIAAAADTYLSNT